MPRLYLVRHGEAAAGWTEDPDPGLSLRGRDQVRAMADALVEVLRPLPVLTSPLRRTRETAEALASRWGVAPEQEPTLGEIPSPAMTSLGERGAWLSQVMDGRWGDLPDDLKEWREGVVEALVGIAHDAVVVTHFVVLNVAVGAADGDDRVVCFRPGYCSVTVMEIDGPSLGVLERGAQADTLVL